LNRADPDIAEAKAALADIIEDDQRAGEVIRKMRGMLKKGQIQVKELDINVVAAESVRLVTSDALLRKLTIHIDLEPGLPMVTGDHIQLQQVILNLLSNAMQSMSQRPGPERSVIVRTRSVQGKDEITLDVEDSGCGVPDWQKALIFQPFFTTRNEGLGMGLSISRSIIEAHQGQLWMEDGMDGGSVFRFSLTTA
jgi:C4-dicarboxylate-specific signal transduction histidine kinase